LVSLKEKFSGLGWPGNVCQRRLDSGASALCHPGNVEASLPFAPTCLHPIELKQRETRLDFQTNPCWVALNKSHGDVGRTCGTHAGEPHSILDCQETELTVRILKEGPNIVCSQV